MLILTRRPGQAVVFPEPGVTVRVLGGNGTTRLGVEAPPNVSILREELASGDSRMKPRPAGRPRGDRSLPSQRLEAPTARLMHTIRNEVNKISLAMQLHDQALAIGDRPRSAEMGHAMKRHLRALSDLCDPAAEQALYTALSCEETDPGELTVAEAAPKPPQTKRLLLVEDDDDERTMFADLLEREGYVVETAEDGNAGLHRLADCAGLGHRFDALLVDMQMPVCNGAEMIHLARQGGYITGVPVLAVSGRCPADYGLPLGDEGANCWLPKPISPAMLLNRLDQCLSLAS